MSQRSFARSRFLLNHLWYHERNDAHDIYNRVARDFSFNSSHANYYYITKE